MVRLQEEPIGIEELIGFARGDRDGALALFLGTVRDNNMGRRVLALEYEAYPEMALAEMERLEQEATEEYGVSRIALVHRTGRLEIGDVSVAIAVAAPHREAAFRACRHLIDRLKQVVPIWKKEHFEGGEVWIEGPQS